MATQQVAAGYAAVRSDLLRSILMRMYVVQAVRLTEFNG